MFNWKKYFYKVDLFETQIESLTSFLFTVEVQSLNLYEELLCTHSPILYNVTLKGGSKGGQFTDLGLVENMEICIELCCEIKSVNFSNLVKKKL